MPRPLFFSRNSHISWEGFFGKEGIFWGVSCTFEWAVDYILVYFFLNFWQEIFRGNSPAIRVSPTNVSSLPTKVWVPPFSDLKWSIKKSKEKVIKIWNNKMSQFSRESSKLFILWHTILQELTINDHESLLQAKMF